MAAKETSSTHTGQQSRAAANSGGGNAAISLPAVPVMEQKETEPVTEANPLQLHAMPDAAAAPVAPNPPPAVQKKATSVSALTTPKQAQPFTQNKSENESQSLQFKEQGSNHTSSSVSSPSAVTAFKPIQKKANNTGLPDNLKSGVENISGYSMDDVKVHYNSPQPKQLQAHAYAQGTDIHVAPGQEQHLAHEAWHVVQQKQGRVKPTIQMKQGVPVNDDAGLEKEADEMGAKALQGKFESSPVQKKEISISSLGSNPVQRKTVTIIGVTIGKTRIYNDKGTAVAHIAKGKEIDVDEGDTYMSGSRKLVRITSGDQNILWNTPEGLLNDDGNIWISATRFKGPEGEEGGEEEATDRSLTIPMFGQELKLNTDGAELSGEVDKELEIDLPNVDLSFDFPLPVAAPVYLTVGLTVGFELKLKVSGTYTVSASRAGQKVTMNATAGGTAGMDVSARVGAGAGIANLAGVEAGMFAGANADFAVEGSINGEVNKDAAKAWAASSLEFKLKSSASLVGKAGAYVSAKVLALRKEKKFTLLEKEFAKWEYERTRSIQKAGVRVSDIIPTAGDFKILISPDNKFQYAEQEDINERTPLLGGSGGASDDD
jgi:hypothetical protein